MTFLILSTSGIGIGQDMNPVVQYFEDKWDPMIESWKRDLKRSYDYDVQNREILFLEEWWNDEKAAWVARDRRETTYTPDYVEECTWFFGDEGYAKRIERRDSANRILLIEHLADYTFYQSRTRTTWSHGEHGSFHQTSEYYAFEEERWIVESYGERNFVHDWLTGCLVLTETVNSGGYHSQILFTNDTHCRPVLIQHREWNDSLNHWTYNSRDSILYTSEIKTTWHFERDEETQQMHLEAIYRESLQSPKWYESHTNIGDSIEFRSREEFNVFGHQAYNVLDIRMAEDTAWTLLAETITEWASATQQVYALFRVDMIPWFNDASEFREKNCYYNAQSDIDSSHIYSRKTLAGGIIQEEERAIKYLYTYYCEKYIKQRIKLLNQQPTERQWYTYLFPVDCPSKSHESLHIYPNPTQGTFYLESTIAETGLSAVTLTDTRGRVLREWHPRYLAGVLEYDISDISDGLYYLWIQGEQKSRRHTASILKLSGR